MRVPKPDISSFLNSCPRQEQAAQPRCSFNLAAVTTLQLVDTQSRTFLAFLVTTFVPI